MAKAREVEGLDCGAGLVEGACLVLRTRIDELCELREAALDFSDLKGVHDMRVSSRRVRSAARDFRPYFRKKDLRELKAGVKRIADALGSVRDEDVAIDALEKFSGEEPPEVLTGIARIKDERVRRRENDRAKLRKVITAETLLTLQADCHAALDAVEVRERKVTTTGGGRIILKAADPSFRNAGREIIRESWQEFDKLSVALCRPLESEPLHDLRIAAKRLRYAIELFAQCWGGALTPHAEEIAEMQSSLGDLHDADVWIEALGTRLRDQSFRREKTLFVQRGAGTDDEVCATVWLINRFVRARTKDYRVALERWRVWRTDKFAARLFETLNS